MAETRRVVIVLAPDGAQASAWDQVQKNLADLSIGDIRRSDISGPVVVTGTVLGDTDMPRLLDTLNRMPAVRNAEEDSWSFNQ